MVKGMDTARATDTVKVMATVKAMAMARAKATARAATAICTEAAAWAAGAANRQGANRQVAVARPRRPLPRLRPRGAAAAVAASLTAAERFLRPRAKHC